MVVEVWPGGCTSVIRDTNEVSGTAFWGQSLEGTRVVRESAGHGERGRSQTAHLPGSRLGGVSLGHLHVHLGCGLYTPAKGSTAERPLKDTSRLPSVVVVVIVGEIGCLLGKAQILYFLTFFIMFN